MYVLNKDEAKIIDCLAINKYKIPSLILMEHAALAVMKQIESRFSTSDKITIICGAGNNGADGLCLARILHNLGYKPEVLIFSDREKLSEEGKIHYDSLKFLGLEINHILFDKIMIIKQIIINSDLIVDAIFGISLNRDVKGIYREVIEVVNFSNSFKISVDMPSGVEVNTGKVLGLAVNANVTVTFAYPKLGLYLYPGAFYAGEIITEKIQIPTKVEYELSNSVIINDLDCFDNMPHRKEDSHKGSVGKVLIIAGSVDMAGAAILSAKAAYKSGCGIAYVLTHRDNRSAILTSLPEAIVYTYDEKFSESDLKSLVDLSSDGKNAILIGPGMGQSDQAEFILSEIINKNIPLVIDADGINILAKNKDLFDKVCGRNEFTILTPHIGEMARLMNKRNLEISENIIENASEFIDSNHLNLCLKSARSVISFASSKTYLNIWGNSGMATGGSGDVLAGVMVSLLAKASKEHYEEAVCKAVYLHSKAGDKAKEKLGEASMLASDIVEYLAFIFLEFGL